MLVFLLNALSSEPFEAARVQISQTFEFKQKSKYFQYYN